MRIQYDPKEDAMYIRFSEEPYAESEEVQEGIIFDRDKSGAIGGIELLNVSERLPSFDPREFKYEIMDSKEKN